MNEAEPINLLPPDQAPQGGAAPRRGRSTLYFFIFLIILAFVYGVARHFALARWPDAAGAYDQITLKPKPAGFFGAVKNLLFRPNNVLAGQAQDRVNILLLGIGGPGHDGPFLSDTNIIVSIKPSTQEVAMISVPRDLGAKIGEFGWRKINSANALGEAKNPGGGGEYARQIFEQTFGLAIPYYARVDFTAFQKIIDAVGGVYVNVPRAFTDSQFPGPNNSFQTIGFSAGEQTLNGEQALNFVRSRHGTNGENSDFARSRRQQLILAALKSELLSAGTILNPSRIKQIADSLSAHVVTNLNFGQLMYLAGLAKDMNGEIKNLVLDSSPNGFLVNSTGDNGAFILSPKTGNFEEVNKAINNVFETNPTLSSADSSKKDGGALWPAGLNVSESKIEVQNGTWRVGLAARVGERLANLKLSVIGVGNSLKRPIEQTAIYAVGKKIDPATLKKLEDALSVKLQSAPPDWLAPNYDNPATIDNEQGMKYNNETDILVILGNDFKE